MTCNNSRSTYDLTLLTQGDIALISERGEPISYSELIVNVNKVSKLLKTESFKSGERIAVFSN
jgi:long-subunit acyl-CoA synthetase (AMP-forming)